MSPMSRPCNIRTRIMPDPPPWRGITHRDVPGTDDESRRMNFAMLKRGKWGCLPPGSTIEGDELRQHLLKVTERARGAAKKGWESMAAARKQLANTNL